jgi:hypothetical protein
MVSLAHILEAYWCAKPSALLVLGRVYIVSLFVVTLCSGVLF